MPDRSQNDKLRASMFEANNRLRFEMPIDEASKQWWINHFYEPFGLTPEGMADAITKSAPETKSAVYHFIDAARAAFSLRIDGDFPGTQEFWYAHRELDLSGPLFWQRVWTFRISCREAATDAPSWAI